VEGIRDGFAGDECFVCGLLWPGERPCRRCGGAMRWHHAAIADDQIVLIKVGRALDAWRALGGDAELEALLDVVHVEAPASLDALADLGGSLDELRRAWATLHPEHAPDPFR